ncbi:MAG: HDOD domain-containing protein, partial [Deltaproteobacteria bacterium]|nr:HDOD domain-containing protein [Deltaproteobacteria bacterium]
ELLERDAVLAARVLKVVQSPFYAGRMSVRSLKQAVVRLGLKSLRDLVLDSAVNAKLFQSRGFGSEMATVMRHSTATAYLARAVCLRAGIDGEYAFMCGLFHDLGVAAALLVLEEMPEAQRQLPGAIWPAISSLHGDAAALVVRKWRLPGALEGVVRFHHQIDSDGITRQLTAAVRLADCLTGEIGLPLRVEGSDDLESNGTTADQARDALGFDESDVAALRVEARTVLNHLAEMGAT